VLRYLHSSKKSVTFAGEYNDKDMRRPIIYSIICLCLLSSHCLAAQGTKSATQNGRTNSATQNGRTNSATQNGRTKGAAQKEWKLIWSDEFEQNGLPDPTKWDFEQGFVRNYEAQWYSADNAYQTEGLLVIEARKTAFRCPAYDPESGNWRKSREQVEWTSASLTTQDRFDFCFGRVEVRAKIPVCPGAWPAIWLLGSTLPWPGNGEIDMLEFYRIDGQPTILANACWAGKTDEDTQWDSSYTPFTHFTDRDADWAKRFHIWRMDWDEHFIRLYLDDELLNEIDLTKTINGKASERGVNPFHHPQYLLLNLALDTRVKQYDLADFPMRYEIDYVRIYQKK